MLAVELIIAGAIPLADAQMSSAGIPRGARSGDPTKQELVCLPARRRRARPGPPWWCRSTELPRPISAAPGVTVGPTGVSEVPGEPPTDTLTPMSAVRTHRRTRLLALLLCVGFLGAGCEGHGSAS